ncbi:MAGa7180 family putative nuclease [Mycoplasma sp. 4463]|uniref:MAGa7180 family putative nuclease n=1 Tax=Mycoplasma sp. 4463 TaxID=3400998 RepID=UPI003AAD277D
MARQYYNKRDYEIDWENSVIVLKDHMIKQLKSDNKFLKYKKIGGSTVSEILIKDAFKNEFNAFCHIAHLKLPVLSQKYINAGTILEPKIFDFLRKVHPNVLIENFVAADYEYNYFKDKDDVIMGVPDGYIPSTNMILEIKTAQDKKYELWGDKDVDPSYRKQAQLYSYLKGASHYSIIALFLRDDLGDYLNPENVDINQRRMKSYTFPVNRADVEDDIKKVKQWYYHYTNTNKSPKFDPLINKDQLEYLQCGSFEEWEKLLNKWKQEGKADFNVKA